MFSQNELPDNDLEMALRPSKATFYSAVLPGLGQAYNKKYWKIPIVYGALATGIYFYNQNDKDYNRYRNAYKRRLAGFSDDEFQGVILNNDRLLDGQDFYRKNKDLSMVFLVGFYFLNILDANIDAHLLDYNVDENLSFHPSILDFSSEIAPSIGIKINYNF